MAKPRKDKEVKEAQYTASLNVLGRDYKATGVSVVDAVSKLEPTNCKGKGILTVSNGEITKEKVIMPFQLFRWFNGSRLMREVGLKNISILFDF